MSMSVVRSARKKGRFHRNNDENVPPGINGTNPSQQLVLSPLPSVVVGSVYGDDFLRLTDPAVLQAFMFRIASGDVDSLLEMSSLLEGKQELVPFLHAWEGHMEDIGNDLTQMKSILASWTKNLLAAKHLQDKTRPEELTELIVRCIWHQLEKNNGDNVAILEGDLSIGALSAKFFLGRNLERLPQCSDKELFSISAVCFEKSFHKYPRTTENIQQLLNEGKIPGCASTDFARVMDNLYIGEGDSRYLRVIKIGLLFQAKDLTKLNATYVPLSPPPSSSSASFVYATPAGSRPAGGGLFGSAAAAPAPASSGGGRVFGGTSAAATSGGLFGGVPAAAASPAPGGGLFGGCPAPAPTAFVAGGPASAPDAFGTGVPAPAPTAFSAGGPAPVLGAFGTGAQAPGVFGTGAPAPAPAAFGGAAPASAAFGGAPAPAPVFGNGAPAPAPVFGNGAPAPAPVFGGATSGGGFSFTSKRQRVLSPGQKPTSASGVSPMQT